MWGSVRWFKWEQNATLLARKRAQLEFSSGDSDADPSRIAAGGRQSVQGRGQCAHTKEKHE